LIKVIWAGRVPGRAVATRGDLETVVKRGIGCAVGIAGRQVVVLQPEGRMARKVKRMAGVVYALAIAAALAFGAQQAVAARNAPDPCVCAHPGSTSECGDCCTPNEGLCLSIHYCLCAR
jgi:hypothetical protein